MRALRTPRDKSAHKKRVYIPSPPRCSTPGGSGGARGGAGAGADDDDVDDDSKGDKPASEPPSPPPVRLDDAPMLMEQQDDDIYDVVVSAPENTHVCVV